MNMYNASSSVCTHQQFIIKMKSLKGIYNIIQSQPIFVPCCNDQIQSAAKYYWYDKKLSDGM